MLDDLLGGHVERGIHHRGFDEDTLAGSAAVLQCQQHTGHRVEPSVRIAHAIGRDRVLVGVPGHPRQPGSVLDHEREGRILTPWPVEPEAGHSDHHDVGADGSDGLHGEPHLFEHTRRVVLDDDVARGDQPA